MIAIVSIGTELTRGEIVNTNASFLGDRCAELGLEVGECATIPDDETTIVECLGRLARSAGVILVTGGLGPTTDDITAHSVATLLGVKLVRDDASLDEIRARFARLGRSFPVSNEKQADFPAGAGILPNPEGTAPGFSVAIGSSLAFFMPGVPREMKPMFENHVLPALQEKVEGGLVQIRIKTFGLAEAAVNDLLAGVEEAFDVTLGYRAHAPEIEVKVLAKAESEAVARARARRGADEVKHRLGRIVYEEGDRSFPEVVGDLLRSRKLTLGLAESCTGGLIAKLLTDAAASDYFLGSVVCYSNSIKEQLLGVSSKTLSEHGAVSEAVARELAAGARRVLGADLALGVTGIAGPTGGTEEKPVGLVHLAVASPWETRHLRVLYPRRRDQVRLYSAFAGLALVRDLVQEHAGK